MCVRVKCKSCGKATYAGCGAHVEQVLRGVAADDRCSCNGSAKASAGDGGDKKKRGWFW